MEEFTEKIYIHYLDEKINDILRSAKPDEVGCSRFYNQSEDFFLKLDHEYTVPQLPIHHDMRISVPDRKYLNAIMDLISGLVILVPGLFHDLVYIFDPTEIHKLKFIKLYRIEQTQYLYFLKIDLIYRTYYHEMIKRGNNDFTAQYKTRCLFLEANLIPVEKEVTQDSKTQYFNIKQTISQTWIGERGRGYFVQGIWMDDDLTKFFTRLFVANAIKMYPYYPFICKYKTICLNLVYFSSAKRKTDLPYLHRALQFLTPNMPDIEHALHGEAFSEDLKIFQTLKQKLMPDWDNAWEQIRSHSYINDNQMKEFQLEI